VDLVLSHSSPDLAKEEVMEEVEEEANALTQSVFEHRSLHVLKTFRYRVLSDIC
jgi:hypothetical protein